jgi:hypothetical protein
LVDVSNEEIPSSLLVLESNPTWKDVIKKAAKRSDLSINI